MALANLSPECIVRAIQECDRIGRDAFLDKYGFGPARQYILEYDGRHYDSKAIVGAAHQFDPTVGRALRADEFSGGKGVVVPFLTDRGFVVLEGLTDRTIRDDEAKAIRSAFSSFMEGPDVAIILHARGGAKTGESAINPDYLEGLKFVLQRAAEAGAGLRNVTLDSKVAADLTLAERTLHVGQPMQLGPQTDTAALAKAIKARQKDAGKKVGAKGGNTTKRVRLLFELPARIDAVTFVDLIAYGTRGRPAVVVTWNPELWSDATGDEAAIDTVALGGDEAGVITPPGVELVEGAVTKVTVNRFERNPVARQQCIDHYGAACAACGIDFSLVYGSFAEGFIHVHHTKPIAEVREAYVVDPVNDLIPVCPNCHAMIHHKAGGSPRSVDEIRALLDGS